MHEITKLPMAMLDVDVSVEITTTQTNEDKRLHRIYIQTQKKKEKYSSKTNIKCWDFASPYTLQFRVVRFMLESGEFETIATSLPRNRFSIDDIKELYHMRWGIETSFCKLKYAIGLINLHCKKEEFAKQEIYAAIIMYNYCSRIAAEAVIHKRVHTVYEYMVDFTMAIHICRTTYKLCKTNFEKLVEDISNYTVPIRPGRKDKREMKPKGFVGFTYRVSA